MAYDRGAVSTGQEMQEKDEYLLRVENLSLKRDGREILSQVNLNIRPGEVHGLLGLNGSGKSSLAYTLMGCVGYTPDTGRIWFAGQDITALPISERAATPRPRGVGGASPRQQD